MNYNLQFKKNIFILVLCLIISGINVTTAIAKTNRSIAAEIQERRVTIDMTDSDYRSIIYKIQNETGIAFFILDDQINNLPKINYSVENVSIKQALDKLLNNTPYDYDVKDKGIAIKRRTVVEQPQVIKVEGKVVDEKGAPVIGATIIVDGTNNGAISDSNGDFIINAKMGDKINVFIVGFEDKTVVVNNEKMTITLKVDIVYIDDIVVTGYQTISKERSSGSFDMVDSNQMDKMASSISERLVGSAAGLSSQVAADGSLQFEIRGKSSLNANAQPLIVVDGFAVEDGFNSINPNDVESITILKDAAASSIWGARSANGVIVVTTKRAKEGKLNVSVSSFYKFSSKLDLDYVKPLAETSDLIDYELYAYGTDFFGGPTKPITNATSFVSSVGRSYSKVISLANEYEMGYISEQQYNQGIETLRGIDNSQQIADYLLDNAATQQYNISISGGTDMFSHNLSLLYEKSNNNFQYNQNNDFLINYKTQAKITKWLDFNFGGMFQNINTEDGGVNLSTITGISPYDNFYNEDGSFAALPRSYNLNVIERNVPTSLFAYDDWGYNPIQDAQNTHLSTRDINTRVQAGLKANIMKGLSISSTIQYEVFSKEVDNIYDEDTFLVRTTVNTNSTWDGANTPDSKVTLNIPEGSFRDKMSQVVETYNFRNQVNFDRTFGSKHSINAIAGMEVSSRVAQSTTYPRAYGYDDEKLTVGGFLNGNTFKSWTGYNRYPSYTSAYTYATDRYISAYLNASYTYNDKYTLTASARTDASNIVSDDPKYRYSPFWSVGANWNIDKEKFMNEVSFVNRLSFRATYGYNGNVDKTTSFVPLISVNGTQNIYTHDHIATIKSFGNPSLRWERTRTFNVGVDYILFDGKLTGSIDYYNKYGKDLIVSVSIPSINGTESQSINQGEMVNNGIEMKIGTIQNIAKGITWTGDFTFSYNKNEITQFYKEFYRPNDLHSGTSSGYLEGYNANTIWAYEYMGMHNFGTADSPAYQPAVQGDGDELYPINAYKHSVDGRTHLVDMGTSVAPINLSLISNLQIYNFDFSFIFTGKLGHVFRRTGFNYPHLQPAMGTTYTGALPNKYLSEVVGIEQAINEGHEYVPIPEVESKYYAQWPVHINKLGYLVENASHIRLQEISLGYTIPERLVKRAGLGHLKIYAQANNIATILFNDYGEDPEYLYGTIKPMPTFTFGLKLSF